MGDVDVWIGYAEAPYDGETIIAVFSTQEKAEEWARQHPPGYPGQSFEVLRLTVDGPERDL